MNKVFLGGTCNNSDWRDQLIPMIQVNFFNPVVGDWTNDCQKIEEIEKKNFCNIHLYVITSEMTGVFNIAEAIDSATTADKQTILHVIPCGFSDGQLRSLQAVCNMVIKHGGIAYIDADLQRTARVINYCYK